MIRLAMRLLPGRLTVDTGGVAGAEVSMDGRAIGRTPLAAFEAEAGEREVRVRADGYEEFQARVPIEGRGKEQPHRGVARAPADAAAGARPRRRSRPPSPSAASPRGRGSSWTDAFGVRRRSSSQSSRTRSTRSG